MSTTSLNRVTLFIPGSPASIPAWQEALGRVALRVEGGDLLGESLTCDVAAEWVANDGAFGDAFSFGNVADEVVEAIAVSPFALVLYFPVDLREGRSEITDVVARLADAGALGVRVEQSKLGWEIAEWLELMCSHSPGDWHRAAIVVLEGEEALQSCGMQAFSLPDVRIERGDQDEDALRELATVFSIYQLAEDPLLRPGQTFSPDPETPRRVLERWPDGEYPPDHVCHNALGVWRLGPPGGRSRPVSELVPFFMPSLAVTLQALEDKAGKRLTQEQVESARDSHPCMMMEPRDVQKVERERGYADIDPELAWEQWQLVRQAD